MILQNHSITQMWRYSYAKQGNAIYNSFPSFVWFTLYTQDWNELDGVMSIS